MHTISVTQLSLCLLFEVRYDGISSAWNGSEILLYIFVEKQASMKMQMKVGYLQN
jgi:hypothetical protein